MLPLRVLFLLVLGALVMAASAQQAHTASGQNANATDDGVGAENNSPESAKIAGVTKRLEEDDGSLDEFKDNICADIEHILDQEEGQADLARRSRRSAYGGRLRNYDGFVDYGKGNGDYYGGNYGYGDSRRWGYGQGGKLSYDDSYTHSPVLTFVKGFKPGKSYVEKGRVVHNYYKHGTYEVALQHYKFIPVIKVVPYTTYDTIGYTGHIQAHNDYTAVICKDCYHGYPKIDLVANKAPYNHLTRRFVYLPESYHIDGHEKRDFPYTNKKS